MTTTITPTPKTFTLHHAAAGMTVIPVDIEMDNEWDAIAVALADYAMDRFAGQLGNHKGIGRRAAAMDLLLLENKQSPSMWMLTESNTAVTVNGHEVRLDVAL
jgi:hypothetical protein